ncbi:cytochrome P450 [Microbacterium aurum]
MTLARAESAIDLMDLDVFTEGREDAVLSRLRAEHPVYWNAPSDNGPGFWGLTRYDDVRDAAADPERLSSAQGTQIVDRKVEGGGRASLHNMDDPEHLALRRIVLPHLGVVKVKQWQEVIESTVSYLLDQAQEAGGEFDLVGLVSARLPMLVLSQVLGVPREDAPRMVDWTNRLTSSDPDDRVDEAALAATREEVLDYFRVLTRLRRENPANDIISILVNGSKDGLPLTWDELAAYYIVLVAAGNETTRHLVSGGSIALDQNRESWDRVLADEQLLPGMVEEMFRYVSPVLAMRRTATTDFELRGQPIAEGDKVVLWFGAANRDPEVFADPDRFDIARQQNPHITFGWGAHFCLGTHLARAEVREFFTQLRRRRLAFEVTGEPQRVRHNLFRGWSSIPAKVLER